MHSLLSNHDDVGDRNALGEILRTFRQICLLHELGRTGEALATQQQHMDGLVAAYRAAHGTGSLTDERLGALVRAEQERVAAAATLSEVLAPLLAERLQAPAAATPSTGGPRVAAGRHAPAAARRPPAGSPAIVDLIDGMLAQEDPPARHRRP